MLKKFVTFLGRVLGGIAALIMVYFLAALIGSLIPVNRHDETSIGNVDVLLRTNGVHTSLVLPVRTEMIDWSDVVDFTHVPSLRRDFDYVSFGWGDREFYENTPEWSDLTPSIAFKALFLKSPAAMNVEFHHRMPQDSSAIAFTVTEQQYRRLSQYILESFSYDSGGAVHQIKGLHYNQRDAFYEAAGSLNLFYTCNTWTNNALKYSGLKACLWTPFDKGIFFQYR